MKTWPYPRLFAHRGGGSLAPENTLAAVRLGRSLGYKAHEFDVKLSKDGVAMLLHDATLERTTSGKGRASDFTWAELLELDAGAWHSEPYRGERLASFEDVARSLIANGDRANVEIKPTPGFERETGSAVAKAAAKLWAGAKVPPLLSSFSFDALMAAQEAAPELPRGWLADEFGDTDFGRLEELQAVSLHTNHAKLDVKHVARVHDRGYRVMLYTVNDVSIAERLFAAGVDGMFTDNLRVFAERLPEKLKPVA
ncbi:MAG: glycerophosphodiester phosphodiesterase [Burkholderiales bacterium]|nr:glycerophosphodiester phosphodiesterase [Burkholderiales bacterium]